MDAILHRNPQIIARKVDKETVILPLYKTSDEVDSIYTLNGAAADVWKLIDGKRTLADIKKNILKKYDISSQEIDEKLEDLLKILKGMKAIK